jgi:hypothetical protein
MRHCLTGHDRLRQGTTLLAAIAIASVLLIVCFSEVSPAGHGTSTMSSGVHVSLKGVNPFNSYSSEPAPIGLDDFGVGPAPGYTPYEYNTSTWVDSANFYSLDVNATAGSFGATPFFPADGLGITLQENVVLVFNDSGTLYYWWVQNVAGITPGGCPPDTTPIFGNGQWEVAVGSCPSNPIPSADHNTLSYIYFINDIYNFSTSGVEGSPFCSGTGILDNCAGSISGQGMVYGTETEGLNVYAVGARQGLPGNQVNLTFPTEVQLRVVTAVIRSDSGSLPYVLFQYDDGFGWQTYDNVSFPFATAVSTNGFQVDGYAYNPDGALTNSEFVIGGFGDGTYSRLNDTSVYMTFAYSNGHNLQTPSNAFDEGGDTAESVEDAQVSAVLHGGTSGSLGVRVLNTTTEEPTLGQMWSSTQVSDLVIISPVSSGTIQFDGKVFPFTGGVYNQTMAPGTYALRLVRGGHLLWSKTVTLLPGARQILTG